MSRGLEQVLYRLSIRLAALRLGQRVEYFVIEIIIVISYCSKMHDCPMREPLLLETFAFVFAFMVVLLFGFCFCFN